LREARRLWLRQSNCGQIVGNRRQYLEHSAGLVYTEFVRLRINASASIRQHTESKENDNE
jgi:hypothetical protein